MSVSIANFVLTELKPPVIVCSEISTVLLDVGGVIITR